MASEEIAKHSIYVSRQPLRSMTGKENASYSPDEHRVDIYTDFIWKNQHSRAARFDRYDLKFMLLHELGHAIRYPTGADNIGKRVRYKLGSLIGSPTSGAVVGLGITKLTKDTLFGVAVGSSTGYGSYGFSRIFDPSERKVNRLDDEIEKNKRFQHLAKMSPKGSSK